MHLLMVFVIQYFEMNFWSNVRRIRRISEVYYDREENNVILFQEYYSSLSLGVLLFPHICNMYTRRLRVENEFQNIGPKTIFY